MRGFWRAGLASATLLAAAGLASAAQPPRLLQHPSLSKDAVAFDFAGEIWTVPRAGGKATPIVVGQGRNRSPIYSPDGQWIAYSGEYDGNVDVYVVPAAGGEPRRLTFHPSDDVAVGWTADGAGVIFRSVRATDRDLPQLWVIPREGGAPTRLPLPSGYEASASPDGAHLAYAPFNQIEPAWKHYAGGQTARIWIADLKDSRVSEIPRVNSNDRDPMWAGERIYFLSDRDGPTTLYAYSPAAKSVTRLIDNKAGFDIQSASAGPGGVVYDQFGALKIYDAASGKSSTVPVTIEAELPQTRARYVALTPEQVLSANITPSGKRVLFEAHGEILSAPAEKGDTRNLSRSPGVADRDPAASPDGRQVAWFSDQGGEYSLIIRAADGMGAERRIALGAPGSFFYQPRWSPDSTRIVFHDKRLNLWLVDLPRGTAPVKIDTDRVDGPGYDFDPSWSPDGRWIAYRKQLANNQHAIWIYDVKSGASRQVTDGMSDAAAPRFDRSGKHLYFAASTSVGLGSGWLDMSSLGRAVDGSIYAILLRKDLPNPVAPESDEEPAAGDATTAPDAAKPATKAPTGATPVDIDFDGLERRTVALPIPAANFIGLEAGAEGVLYPIAAPKALSDEDLQAFDQGPPPVKVSRFDLKTRKAAPLLDGVDPGSFRISADGTKMLFSRHGEWTVAGADASPKGEEKPIDLASVQVFVDPRAEWRQMYDEVWRLQRDFLYDPNTQGLNIARAKQVYAPFLEGLGGRQDLNTLFEEMTGQIGVGHMYVRGGALPEQKAVKTGLLGADFAPVEGRWKIARIYQSESWNPKLHAPLAAPGVNVAEGEFLLAVNGRELRTSEEIFAGFQALAGKRTVLTVGPKADGTGARQVVVTPVASERELRTRAWMEANRRKVDALSGGRLAYVYVPDTAAGGFAFFNRYYFGQVGKQGAIIDERFNHGGDIADFIVDELIRQPRMINASREGERVIEPAQAIFGPKVMLINRHSGSGGDALPWLFRKANAGTLIGTRTWGGLIGIGDYPPLIDGGMVTAPRWAIYGLTGQWEVENIGIAPDIEVEQDPYLVRQGHDPQLERAVQVALDALAKSPPPTYPAAPYPDRKPVLPEPPR